MLQDLGRGLTGQVPLSLFLLLSSFFLSPPVSSPHIVGVVVVLKGGGILTGGVFGSWPKQSHWGSVWAKETQWLLNLNQGNGGGVVYSTVEGLGGGKWVVHKGGGSWVKN